MERQNPYEELNRKLDRIEANQHRLQHQMDQFKKTFESPPPVERLYKAQEYCERVGIDRSTLWRREKRGEISPVMIGNLKRYKIPNGDKMDTQR